MRLLFIFLFISGISYSQGKVMSRHDNGQKEWVNVYTGTGINEKLTTRYYYDEHDNNYVCKITYSSTKGNPIEKLVYEYDENGKRFLLFKYTSSASGNKRITFKADGTIESTDANSINDEFY